MRQALLHASRGRGTTSPNPMVGCVVVTPEGVVVGLGYHHRAGEPHAEVLALRAAGGRAAGATLYVTLEPCNHTGRTGPCTEAILAAGVARVVAAMVDPDPRVAGGGLERLRRAGLEVAVGVGERAAARLNEPFVTAMTRRRPFVLLKVASSVDGRIASAAGQCTRLTSHLADLRVHRTRAEVDAIMAGADTVLVDDPRLTARLVFRARPLVRVIVDWRLRVPPTARVFDTLDEGPIIIAATAAAVAADGAHAAALAARGADVVSLPARDLAALFAELGRREIRSVLVEGGAALHRACIAAGCADRVHRYVTPHVLGRDGVAWEIGAARLDTPEQVLPLGPDVFLDSHVYRTR